MTSQKTFERTTGRRQFVIFAGAREPYASNVTFVFGITVQQAEWIRQFVKDSRTYLRRMFVPRPSDEKLGAVSIRWPFTDGLVQGHAFSEPSAVTAYVNVSPFPGHLAESAIYTIEAIRPLAMLTVGPPPQAFECESVLDLDSIMLHTDGEHARLSAFATFGGESRTVSTELLDNVIMEILGCPVQAEKRSRKKEGKEKKEKKDTTLLYGKNVSEVMTQIAWLCEDGKPSSQVSQISGKFPGAWRQTFLHHTAHRVFVWYQGAEPPAFVDQVSVFGDAFPASACIRMEIATAVYHLVMNAEAFRCAIPGLSCDSFHGEWSAIVRRCLNLSSRYPEAKEDFLSILKNVSGCVGRRKSTPLAAMHKVHFYVAT